MFKVYIINNAGIHFYANSTYFFEFQLMHLREMLSRGQIKGFQIQRAEDGIILAESKS